MFSVLILQIRRGLAMIYYFMEEHIRIVVEPSDFAFIESEESTEQNNSSGKSHEEKGTANKKSSTNYMVRWCRINTHLTKGLPFQHNSDESGLGPRASFINYLVENLEVPRALAG
jgi:hypothetical protein